VQQRKAEMAFRGQLQQNFVVFQDPHYSAANANIQKPLGLAERLLGKATTKREAWI
jgi:hypothetical protein